MVNYEPSPFLPIVSAWHELAARAQQFKDERFGPEAAEGLRFYSGPYDFWFKSIEPDRFFNVPGDNVRDENSIVVTCNKVAEMVQLFGPFIYHQNPMRRFTYEPPVIVSPLALGLQPDPQSTLMYQQSLQNLQSEKAIVDAQCELFDKLLNYTPEKLDFETHARTAAIETLIKGASTLWSEEAMFPGGGYKTNGTVWDSIDNLLIDPDCKSLQTARWVARREFLPVWEAEKRYGCPPGYLNATSYSAAQRSAIDATGRGPISVTNSTGQDLIEICHVYSKMGVGGRIKQLRESNPDLRAFCELFGDFTYLVIARGCPHPLNCPPWIYRGEPDRFEQGRTALQWPTPFWADRDWPMEVTHFHVIPGDPWPLSHLSPGMGELKFLNWVYSKMVNKIRVTSRELLACDQSVATELENWLQTGVDCEIVKYNGIQGKTAKELIEFIQHPTWNPDIWKVLQAVSDAFDKRVGLTELMYGVSDTQSRSAADAQTKSAGANIRPDDMAKRFERSMSRVARREMLHSAWHRTPQDVLPCLGALGAAAWGRLISGGDPATFFQKINVRVEAGTARRPNTQQFQANMQAAVNQMFQPLLQYAMTTGNPQPFNNLITDWARSIQLNNVERYLIPPPAPQPMQGSSPAAKPPG